MKLKIWKTITMLAIPLGLTATLPVVVTSCGSATPSPSSAGTNYNPSNEISKKISQSDFDTLVTGLSTKFSIQKIGTLKSVKLTDAIFEYEVILDGVSNKYHYNLIAETTPGENYGKYNYKVSNDDGINWVEKFIPGSQLKAFFDAIFKLPNVNNDNPFYKPSEWIKEKITLQSFNILNVGHFAGATIIGENDHIELNDNIFLMYFQAYKPNSELIESTQGLWYFDLKPISSGENAGLILHKRSLDNGVTWVETSYRTVENVKDLFDQTYSYGIGDVYV